MARMNGRNRFPIDASLILNNSGLAALTAATTFAWTPLVSSGAYWQNPADARDGVVYVVGHVESVTGSPTAISLDIVLADDAIGTNTITVESTPITNGEWFETSIDSLSLTREYPTKQYWAAKLNFSGGTTPAVAAFVYMAPDWD